VTGVRRTQQQRVEESTKRLVRAAAELIAEGGYEAATAAEIGRRAGYSRSMVRARFGSKEALLEAVVTSAYEGPVLAALPESASGLQRVLARLDATAVLIDESPALLRMVFAIEFQAAGSGSRMSRKVADWVARLRADIHAAILDGQADHSIRADVDAEPTAHAIVVEGIGSAFMWIVDPAEDFRVRITQWREHTLKTLTFLTPRWADMLVLGKFRGRHASHPPEFRSRGTRLNHRPGLHYLLKDSRLRFGEILPAKVWIAIFPSWMRKVSVAISNELSAVSAARFVSHHRDFELQVCLA
jgi:AcrR family transcriptional regulator